MFFQLLYIHLFRPFLKYNPDNSPLPAHVSPRKLCTQAAAMISKLLRLYKRSHGLRQICNICVYIAHSACTIHLLNLPEKNAKRDIIHGVKHLEEIAEGWICARRTLGILSVLAKRWKIELPEEADAVLKRTDSKFGPWSEVHTPKPSHRDPAQILDQHPSPADQASPSLQPYRMNIANVSTPQYLNRMPQNNNSVSIDPYTRSSESLPPSDPNALAYMRTQHHRATPSAASLSAPTPASTQGRQSIDGQSTAGNSPSQMFGGVDQLIREGQDWIFRDQTQLANGFDNWGPTSTSIDDIASWFASTQSPTGGFPALTNPAMSMPMNGGPVGGASTNGYPSVNGGGNPNVNGPNSVNNINGLQGFTYDEGSWYDYQ
jgi:hypothetical protein